MQHQTTTVKHAAFIIGIGRTKLYDLINSGELKTLKVGRRRLIRTDSIRALVDQAA